MVAVRTRELLCVRAGYTAGLHAGLRRTGCGDRGLEASLATNIVQIVNNDYRLPFTVLPGSWDK